LEAKDSISKAKSRILGLTNLSHNDDVFYARATAAGSEDEKGKNDSKSPVGRNNQHIASQKQIFDDHKK